MRPWMHWAAAAVILAAAGLAYATYPWTKLQCYEWAAGRRTDLMSKLAYEVCSQRFGDL